MPKTVASPPGLGLVAALALQSGLLFGSLPATAADAIPVAEVESTRLWFIELNGPPTADGSSAASVRAEKDTLRRNARARGIRFQERRAFDTLWNGLSVSADPAAIAQLRRLEGVKAVFPVVQIPRPDAFADPGNVADMATAVSMTGADIARSQLGYTGAGVRVGIIDTGIDVNHPLLGGSGTSGNGQPGDPDFPNVRVVTGFDFVGDAYDASSNDPLKFTPFPDANPDDCNGHGTHVAGIVGASGALNGVAPGVDLGAYRVFGCEGSSAADVILAALERSLADGMQVVNLSLGAAYQWPQYPTALACDRLVNRGVVVVASAGNNGQGTSASPVTDNLFSLGAPGVGNKVISVASIDNIAIRLDSFLANGTNRIGYAAASGAPLPPKSGSLPLVRTGTTSSTSDACSALAPGSLAGKAVLIRRGGCTFYQKALNAQNAGAAAVILYNNAAGRFTPTVVGATPITIPVVSISGTEGALLNSLIAAGPVTFEWTADPLLLANPTGNLISSFSSFGMSPELTLKPDLAAPGGAIYSTYPLGLGGFATLSGTSMASPHVAGAVALLLEARPRLAIPQVRSLLQNSADPRPWGLNPGLGILDNVHRQGAGLLDIDDAILATTRVEPGKVSLGEGEAGPRTVSLTVRNDGPTAVTYNLSSVNAASTGSANGNGTLTASFELSDASVVFGSPSVTVPAGGSATVSATITPATAPNRGQYGGYLVLTPSGTGQPLRVPFAGFIGDYQTVQVLRPTANNFPWLAKIAGSSYANQPAGATYTMAGDDIPVILVRLEHYSRRLRLEVQDAVTGRNWHRVFPDEQYVTRNSSSGGFFALAWDGFTVVPSGSRLLVVPNGRYVIQLSVLKALGDENNPAHWETWTSPVITVARP